LLEWQLGKRRNVFAVISPAHKVVLVVVIVAHQDNRHGVHHVHARRLAVVALAAADVPLAVALIIVVANMAGKDAPAVALYTHRERGIPAPTPTPIGGSGTGTGAGSGTDGVVGAGEVEGGRKNGSKSGAGAESAGVLGSSGRTCVAWEWAYNAGVHC